MAENSWQNTNLTPFSQKHSANYSAFQVPLMDSMSSEGEKILFFRGNIKMKDVTFSYPARPDVRVSLKEECIL